MKCLTPNFVWTKEKDGKLIYEFKGPNEINHITPNETKAMMVNCMNCKNCLINQNYKKNLYLLAEATLHESTLFLTLTYDDPNLPLGGNLEKRDVQLFLKRLRKKISPTKIRYFLVGEYGGKFGRPHYHLIIYGLTIHDLVFHKKSKKGNVIYNSNLLNKIWGKGWVAINKDINIDTIKYLTNYLKKENNKWNNIKQIKEFSTQSTRPAIGFGYFYHYTINKNKIQVINLKKDLDDFYIQGKKLTPTKTINKYLPQSIKSHLQNKIYTTILTQSYDNDLTIKQNYYIYKNNQKLQELYLIKKGYDPYKDFNESKDILKQLIGYNSKRKLNVSNQNFLLWKQKMNDLYKNNQKK